MSAIYDLFVSNAEAILLNKNIVSELTANEITSLITFLMHSYVEKYNLHVLNNEDYLAMKDTLQNYRGVIDGNDHVDEYDFVDFCRKFYHNVWYCPHFNSFVKICEKNNYTEIPEYSDVYTQYVIDNGYITLLEIAKNLGVEL